MNGTWVLTQTLKGEILCKTVLCICEPSSAWVKHTLLSVSKRQNIFSFLVKFDFATGLFKRDRFRCSGSITQKPEISVFCSRPPPQRKMSKKKYHPQIHWNSYYKGILIKSVNGHFFKRCNFLPWSDFDPPLLLIPYSNRTINCPQYVSFFGKFWVTKD